MTDPQKPAGVLDPWHVLDEQVLLEVPRMRVTQESVRLQDGRQIDDYFQIHMGRAVVIAALDEQHRYVLLRMYKHGPRRSGLGFPGGGVGEGETDLAAARRELIEETGYESDDWRALGGYTVHSNQGCGFVSFFLARGARKTQAVIEDDLERHEFVLLPEDELRAAVRDGVFLSMGHVCMAALVLSLG